MNNEVQKAKEYINEGIKAGQWNHEDFEGLTDAELVELVKRLKKKWRI